MIWKPQDVIACIVIIGGITMICLGIDGNVKYGLLAVVGLYYGIDLTPFIKLGRNQKPKTW
ncbi:hypothetical protein ES705_23069 [subsurface metagenome]